MNTEITSADIEAALQRSQAEGQDILDRLLEARATPHELAVAVTKRGCSVIGVLETTGLLLAITNFVELTPRLLQLAAEQGAQAADKRWAGRLSELEGPLQGWVVETAKAFAAMAEKAGVPCPPIPALPPPVPRLVLPPPAPAAPRKIEFTYDAAGEIVGATMH